jgi:DNA mismatch repair protein MutS
MKTDTVLDTPLMKQYQSVKVLYPHAIVFFRLGDFYEMFNEDARVASAELGLTLTARQSVPMCGVPYHSASGYISRLLKAGHKIAICEQQPDESEPGARTKLFKREVVRLITPGTLIEDELLESSSSNYLVCAEVDIVGWGLACLEVSTGEFWATQKMGDPDLKLFSSLLARISPSEILAERKSAAELEARGLKGEKTVLTVSSVPSPELVAPENWKSREMWANKQLALKAALRALAYVGDNEPRLRDALQPVYREPFTAMQLDENAVRTLELVESSSGGGRKYSLWGVLNHTATPMGARLLREWILQPLTELTEIHGRQNCVAELVDNQPAREALGSALREISDVERAMSRVAASGASPRDMGGIRRSLLSLDAIRKWFENGGSSVAPDLWTRFEGESARLYSLRELLGRALCDNLPQRLSDGGVMREGFSAELDEIRSLTKNSRSRLGEIEARERQATQIPSLKVGYNSVFGYYLEVTRTHAAKVPYNYVRKQTLSNAERYITEELKELENKILGAQDRILRLESQLFEELRKSLMGNVDALRTFARTAAELDVYCSLAIAAKRGNYVRPEVNLEREIAIDSGRHPAVEANLPPGAFVPNNLSVGGEGTQILIITGPNMSGKSIYLRQNALIVIMAQMGGFVPAAGARIGIVDRIMTRIGAHDALSRGESTFMVEMRETAAILKAATPRSLVLLDEVGRGTSTFDGISIAWAVVEYLRNPKGGPHVIFATHYFELTELEEKYPGVKNFNVEVREWTNSSGKTELLFLHKIADGPADKSYGIHVAELAGLPAPCIIRARKLLEELEKKTGPAYNEQGGQATLPLFGASPVIEELKACDPEKLTPLDALHAIVEWKKRLS